MVNANAVRVNTREFEFSHGRQPRGFGSWAFSFGYKSTDMEDVFFVHRATFAEARKQAKNEAARRGQFEINVLS